jgi:two-component system chemotaxis family response regulator WspR
MANDQTGSPDQRATTPIAKDGADATLEAARAALQVPLPAEQPVMVLLVDDQAIVAEAVRQALA